MKIILLMIILLSVNVIFTQNIDLNWNDPEIYSISDFTYLDISGREKFIFSDLRNNFALENFKSFQKNIAQYFSQKKQGNFFSYYSPHEKFYLRLNLQTGMEIGKDISYDHYRFVYYGLKFSGFYGKHIYFYSNWWKGHFADDLSLAKGISPILAHWYQYSDDRKFIYTDNFRGKLSYKMKHLQISLGRGKYSIGNNIGGSIILNDDCDYYGYFSAALNLEKISVSFIHASLLPDSISVPKIKYNDKYLVIHKIDWKPSDKYHLFFGECTVYGNRSIDVNYFLPFAFNRIIEHKLGDRDNMLIFLGNNFHSARSTIYVNFIFDEFSKSKIFTDWWGNKYAFQSGVAFSPSLKFWQRTVLEFTAVRPWIYTHKILENKYSHDGVGLGFPSGSNLIQMASETIFALGKDLKFISFLAFTKQGSIGNSFSLNYNDRKSDSAKWLAGDISRFTDARFILDWNFLTHHKIKFGLQFLRENSDLKRYLFFNYNTSF